MVVIGSLSMVSDGGGCGGVGRALGGHWRVVRAGAGSLSYRQIKLPHACYNVYTMYIHCSGYVSSSSVLILARS